MKYVMLVCLGFYVLVMFIESSVHHNTIMTPAQLLWAFMLFITGPVMFLTSIIIIARKLLRKQISSLTLVTALLCIVLVPIWTFGFWSIGKACRPVMFSLVITSNTELAELAIKEHAEGETFTIRRFRYPLCRLPIVHAYHTNGILFLTVPSGPGPKDTILFDPEKKRDHTGHRSLGGAWWFSEYKGH